MKALELLPPSETMYRALVNRDPSFEGYFLRWRAHDRNFLPADLLGEKAGARECRFFRNPERGTA